jgi:hypothetical protein
VDGDVSWGSELAWDGVNECVEIGENIEVIELSSAINSYFPFVGEIGNGAFHKFFLSVSKVDLFLFTRGNE